MLCLPRRGSFAWTDRLDIICLGRCSCTNQVSSVSLSVLCRQRMNISPVTQKKKKKKKKNSIWAASQVAQRASATQLHPPASPATSQPPAQLTSRLALKTATAMVRQDWAKCNDDVRQVAGVCSSWLRGRDPGMTLESFQNLWCHNGVLAAHKSSSACPAWALARMLASGSASCCKTLQPRQHSMVGS